MLSEHAKELFSQLELDYPPVAVKFAFNIPASIERCEQKMPLCCYLKDVQDTGRTYYVDLADETCSGKCVLGAADFRGSAKAGLIGAEHGYYRSAAGNAHMYHEICTLTPGACNYVVFAPVADCTFSPDLIIFVAPTMTADIIMRACSYITGEPYESKSTIALSCAWTYAYPYVTGKVNFCITGMHYGMRRKKMYPLGLHLISVPYQKIDNMLTALDEMEWELIGYSDDPAVKAISQASDAKVMEMSDSLKPFPLDERLR